MSTDQQLHPTTDGPAGYGRPPVHNGSHPTAALGMEYNPFDPRFRADPHVFFAKAREQAPVCYNPIFNMWLVTGHREVLAVCSDEVTFASGNKVDPPDSVLPEVVDKLNTEGFPVALQLFNTDLADHPRLRTLVGTAFTSSALATVEPHINQRSRAAVDRLTTLPQPVDLYSEFTDPLPLTILLDFLGIPERDHQQIRDWDMAWARLFTSAHAIDDQLEAVDEVIAYQWYLHDLIEARRSSPANDMISRCVTARHPDYEPLQTDEIIWQTMGMLAAGHATTTDALTHLLHVLLTEPSLWRQLIAEPGRVDDFVEESLRYRNPVLGLPRLATRDVTLGGVTIPAGSDVLVSFASANRDPSQTPDRPNEFDPNRANLKRHLGFGWGTHHCIGGRLAKAMMRHMLTDLGAAYPDLRLADSWVAGYNEHPFLWGLSSLQVQLSEGNA